MVCYCVNKTTQTHKRTQNRLLNLFPQIFFMNDLAKRSMQKSKHTSRITHKSHNTKSNKEFIFPKMKKIDFKSNTKSIRWINSNLKMVHACLPLHRKTDSQYHYRMQWSIKLSTMGFEMCIACKMAYELVEWQKTHLSILLP